MSDHYRTVRLKPESARALSALSVRTGAHIADLPSQLVAALGGLDAAAAVVLRHRLAALGLDHDTGRGEAGR